MAETQPHQRASSAWQWLIEGWHTLRDKAASAMTYFAPQQEDDSRSQRWGVLASDVTEHSDDVRIELELPGLEKADLSVEVHRDRVVIAGEKRSSSTRKEGSVVVTERAYGRFQRVVPMPCDVSTEGSKATYKNGVLEVTVAKDRSQQPRAIPVSEG